MTPISREQSERSDGDQVAVIPTDRVRAAAVWAASRVAVGLHHALGRSNGEGFGILMYHRVSECFAGATAPTYNVTPAQLRSQLAGLIERGFEPWPLSKILAARAANSTVPSHVFAVTFDDGYENNLTAALPVLQDLNVPATVFLATAFLDSERPFPSDDWKDAGSQRVAPQSWRPLTTRQCHTLVESGLVELGAHTHTHQFFLGRPNLFRSDLQQCLAVLSEQFGIERPAFAFPFGHTDEQLRRIAAECGVSCALTVRFSRVAPEDDRFDWGRFNAADTDTAATLAAKLAGWYEPVATAIRTAKRPLAALRRGNRHVPSAVAAPQLTPPLQEAHEA